MSIQKIPGGLENFRYVIPGQADNYNIVLRKGGTALDVSGIADMSIMMNSSKLQMAVGVSLTKKAMDQQEIVAQEMLEMLPSDPSMGNYVDVMA